MEAKRTIYVIDDEESARTIVERYLVREGYDVQTFTSAEKAMNALNQLTPDMVVLDIMLPGISGYDLCKWIRARSDLPIIMVSARDEEVDRILGLELGSDDYLAKPFSPRELVARVRTVFRRLRGSGDNDVITNRSQEEVLPFCGSLILREQERRITNAELELSLTTKEFDLLAYLVKHKSRAFTREQLIRQIWGYTFVGDDRSIDDLVKRLRKKMNAVASSAEIITVWGYGYKLEAAASEVDVKR